MPRAAPGSTHELVEDFAAQFPGITAMLARHGLDPARDLLPVAPALHYAMGGIQTDLEGRTTQPGLWAVGEVARTGVHGANRLASNSLLEGLVFADRAGRSPGPRAVATRWLRFLPCLPLTRQTDDADAACEPIRQEMRDLMTADVGVQRSESLPAPRRAGAERPDARQRPRRRGAPTISYWWPG